MQKLWGINEFGMFEKQKEVLQISKKKKGESSER